MLTEYQREGGYAREPQANLTVGGRAPYTPADLPTQFDPQMGYSACVPQGGSNQRATVVVAWHYQPNLLVPAIQRQAQLDASGWGQRYNSFAQSVGPASSQGS